MSQNEKTVSIPTFEQLHDEAMLVLQEALKYQNYAPYPDGRIQVAEFIVETVRIRSETQQRYELNVKELLIRQGELDCHREGLRVEEKE